jgi:hypothetical protein
MRRPKLSAAVLLIYVALAWTFASVYDRTDGRIYATPTLSDLVHFTGSKPMQLRFLVPLIDNALISIGLPLESANKLVMAAASFVILVFFGRLLRRFMPEGVATWASIAILYPMLWNYCLLVYGDFPSDIPAIAFFLIVLDLLLDRRWLLSYLAFIVACLNRETIIFAPLAFLFAAWATSDRQNALVHFIVLLAIWFGIREAIAFYFRNAPGGATEWQLPYNLIFLKDALHLDKSIDRLAIFTFGGLHIAALALVWRAPSMVKRLFLVVPIICAVLFVYGLFNEVRIFNEVVPLVTLVVLVRLAERFGAPSRVQY